MQHESNSCLLSVTFVQLLFKLVVLPGLETLAFVA